MEWGNIVYTTVVVVNDANGCASGRSQDHPRIDIGVFSSALLAIVMYFICLLFVYAYMVYACLIFCFGLL